MTRALLRRADAYQAQAYAEGTKQLYAREIDRFAAFAATPRPELTYELLAACLAKRAQEAGPSSVALLLQAVKHWARRNGGREVAEDPRLLEIIDGARRARPAARRPHYSPNDLSAGSRALGDAPLDRRDRALWVFGFAAMPTLAALQALRARDCTFTHDDLELLVDLSYPHARTVRLGRADDPWRCPVRTLRAWLETRRPRADDFVFVGRGVRSGWNATGAPRFLISSALHRTAYLAGLGPHRISLQTLRASGIRLAGRRLSLIPLVHLLGLTSPRALAHYGVPMPVLHANAVRAWKCSPYQRDRR